MPTRHRLCYSAPEQRLGRTSIVRTLVLSLIDAGCDWLFGARQTSITEHRLNAFINLASVGLPSILTCHLLSHHTTPSWASGTTAYALGPVHAPVHLLDTSQPLILDPTTPPDPRSHAVHLPSSPNLPTPQTRAAAPTAPALVHVMDSSLGCEGSSVNCIHTCDDILSRCFSWSSCH